MKRLFVIAILMMSAPLAAYSIVPTLYPGSLQGNHLIPLIGGPGVSVPYYLEMSQIEAFVLSNTTLPATVSCSSGYYVSSYLASTGSFTCTAGGSGSGLPYTISSGRAITGYSITFQNVSSAIYNNPMNVPTGAVSSNSTTAFPTDAQVLAFVGYSCPAGTGPHKNTALDGGTVCTSLPSGGSSGNSSNTSWGLVPTQVTINQTIQAGNAYKVYNKRTLTFRNHSTLGKITVFNNATGNTKCIPDSATTNFRYAIFSGYTTSRGYSLNIPGMTYAQFMIYNDGVITVELASNSLLKTGINEYSSSYYSYTDNFLYSNGALPTVSSGLWATPSASGITPINVSSNTLVASASPSTNMNYYTGWNGGNDQCSQLMTNGYSYYAGPATRISPTTGSYYRAGTTQVYYNTGSGGDQLLGNYTAVGSGQTIKLCSIGNMITVYSNGTQIYSGTDAHVTTGYPGAYILYTGEALTQWVGSTN
jgi:hypothetical protein